MGEDKLKYVLVDEFFPSTIFFVLVSEVEHYTLHIAPVYDKNNNKSNKTILLTLMRLGFLRVVFPWGGTGGNGGGSI